MDQVLKSLPFLRTFLAYSCGNVSELDFCSYYFMISVPGEYSYATYTLRIIAFVLRTIEGTIELYSPNSYVLRLLLDPSLSVMIFT